MKIQGSTQFPASTPQMDAVQGPSKKDKADTANGPASSTNYQERTPPQVPPRNPAAEQKFEGQRIAADLNARLDHMNDATKNDQPKPADRNAYFDLEWEVEQ